MHGKNAILPVRTELSALQPSEETIFRVAWTIVDIRL
jgi:hypothetical protein